MSTGSSFWRSCSARILRGIRYGSITGSQPLPIWLSRWPQTWRRAIFFRAWQFEQANLTSEFSRRATAGATALQRGVQEHLEVLYSLGAVYTATSRPLNREVFRDLTQGPLKRYPGVQGLGWIPRVSEAEREAYLAAAQKDGLVDFEITEWTPRWQVVR